MPGTGNAHEPVIDTMSGLVLVVCVIMVSRVVYIVISGIHASERNAMVTIAVG